jgi:hypothetical membrane protein
MTTVPVSHGASQHVAQPARQRAALQTVLLACGVGSSLIYIATDVIGGLIYPGYSFFSQAISELGAIGAPSGRFVDAMFLIYNLLVLVFGIGVFHTGSRGNRPLRVTGAVLIAFGTVGLFPATGIVEPTYFKMHQRGMGDVGTDAPHIILTAVLVTLWLIAMAAAAFALGRRFRVYSLGTLFAVILFGSLTTPYAVRIAAGQPTPWFGVIERIDVYIALLWMALLGIALLRRRPVGDVRRATRRPSAESSYPAPGRV